MSNQTLRQRLKGVGLPTAPTGVTVTHYPIFPEVVSKLAINTTIEGGDNASLAVGKAIFLPGVGAVVLEAEMNVTLAHQDTIKTDTPDVGLGTVIASGAVALLGGTGTFENIITGQTSGAIDGTNPIIACNRNLVQSVTANGVFLNIADGWANVTDLTIAITGTVWLRWRPASYN